MPSSDHRTRSIRKSSRHYPVYVERRSLIHRLLKLLETEFEEGSLGLCVQQTRTTSMTQWFFLEPFCSANRCQFCFREREQGDVLLQENLGKVQSCECLQFDQ